MSHPSYRTDKSMTLVRETNIFILIPFSFVSLSRSFSLPISFFFFFVSFESRSSIIAVGLFQTYRSYTIILMKSHIILRSPISFIFALVSERYYCISLLRRYFNRRSSKATNELAFSLQIPQKVTR